MIKRVLLAYKRPEHGWRERSFKSECECWAFVVTLDADVDVRWLDTPSEGYGHALHLLRLADRGS